MEDRIIKSRLWSVAELCGQSIDIAGQHLEPDETKAYIEFKLAHGYTKASRAITAFGTTFHPGTVANSYKSMLHQNLNYGHRLRAYDRTKDRKDIPRDFGLGAVVAVEYPQSPTLGWTIEVDKDPHIRAAGVIHKQMEKVSSVFGEHMGGKHKWTVSLEMDYSLLQSGFMIGNVDKAKKKQAELMAETTPRDFQSIGMGYVPMEAAPDSLVEAFNFEKRRMDGDWEGLPVVLMKGGINGQVHFKGVGLVRYGAERQAEIQQILARDPDALEELTEESLAAAVGYFNSMGDLAKRVGEFFEK